MKKYTLSAAMGMACAFAVPMAQATNGYMSHAYSPAAKGLAGAGEAALPQDALSIVGNPAGLTRIGRRLDFGAAWFSPRREYKGTDLTAPGINIAPVGNALTGGTVDSENNDFLIPQFGYSYPLDDKSAIGVAVFGNGGMNTDFRNDDTFMGLGTFGGANPMTNPPLPGLPQLGGGDAGVNLEQLGISLAYARNLTDTLSIGVSGIIAYQTFEAKGLGSFQGFTKTFVEGALAGAPRSPDSLTDNDADTSWGGGFQIGALWDVHPMVSLGISYRSKMWMQEFDEYSDLFAGDGDFDIPAVGSIGLAFRPNDRLTFALDVQQIWYGDIDSIANENQLAERCDPFNQFGNAASFDASYCLGGDNGAGFGWDDMTVLKLGVQYAVNDRWTLRAGYSHGDQPISGSQVAFNTLAPAVIEDHWTLGATWRLRDDYQLTFWGMYAPKETVEGPGAFTTGSSPEISMYQYEIGVNFSWLFN